MFSLIEMLALQARAEELVDEVRKEAKAKKEKPSDCEPSGMPDMALSCLFCDCFKECAEKCKRHIEENSKEKAKEESKPSSVLEHTTEETEKYDVVHMNMDIKVGELMANLLGKYNEAKKKDCDTVEVMTNDIFEIVSVLDMCRHFLHDKEKSDDTIEGCKEESGKLNYAFILNRLEATNIRMMENAYDADIESLVECLITAVKKSEIEGKDIIELPVGMAGSIAELVIGFENAKDE